MQTTGCAVRPTCRCGGFEVLIAKQAASTHWSRATIGLHWLVAGLACIQVGLGVLIVVLPASVTAPVILLLHFVLGTSLFILTLARIAIRLRGRPLHPPHAPVVKLLGQATHAGLYILLLALPLTGILAATKLLLPPAGLHFDGGTAAGSGSPFALAHTACAVLFCCLASLHLLAAFKHLLWDRDKVVAEFLPHYWNI